MLLWTLHFSLYRTVQDNETRFQNSPLVTYTKKKGSKEMFNKKKEK